MSPEELARYMEKQKAIMEAERLEALEIEQKELELRDARRKAQAAKELRELEERMEQLDLDSGSQQLSEDDDEADPNEAQIKDDDEDPFRDDGDISPNSQRGVFAQHTGNVLVSAGRVRLGHSSRTPDPSRAQPPRMASVAS
jgi:hypothetical protein